jgi:enolase
MNEIADLTAWEILDSRGLPTVLTRCRLAGGHEAMASVPSGRSTGAGEAIELRDGNPSRYGGAGCLDAVAGVNGEIAAALRGRSFDDQAGLDAALIGLDGTGDKSRLGANAVLSVSVAYAKAAAAAAGLELWEYFAAIAANPHPTLPALTVNLFSGGKHAGEQVPVQDTLLVPRGSRSVAASLELIRSVFTAGAALTEERYGARLLTADEGGLAPGFGSVDEMFTCAVDAIERAGLVGGDMALAVDVAASHFAAGDVYSIGGTRIDGPAMIALIEGWVQKYPIISVEDGLAEDDWDHWPALLRVLEGRALVVGDDLLCTNPRRITRAIEAEAADTLLLKVNQIGTLSEALDALGLARRAGWRVVASARSGETEDSWLADLAVGWSADFIKVGSVTQSERLAKYNRLLVIEAETGLPRRDV